MAEHLNGTLDAIEEAIRDRESFVVEAGAGSGKTRSLIETIQSVLNHERDELESLDHKVVCITYTNVAKDEIIERLNGDPLVMVDTIHEFLWAVISPYQKELRAEVAAINSTTKIPIADLEEKLATTRITYGQYGRHFDRGELFHDDVITVARALFEKYPKINRIAADRFPYIFVDEYQDTAAQVVELLLDFFVKNTRKPVVGFFGDTMQQIYDSNISNVAEAHGLRTITKVENYRCSVRVIDVLNRLRTDLAQVPSGNNREGDVHLFLAPTADAGVHTKALAVLGSDGWTTDNTKILMLTHRGIAREIGCAVLFDAYAKRSFGNDVLMERQDQFGQFFTFVEGLVAAYQSGRYGTFLDLLGQSGFTIKSLSDKTKVLDEVRALETVRMAGTVADVVGAVTGSKLIPLPRRVSELMNRLANSNENDESFARRRPHYEAVLAVPWSQVTSFIDYADQHTPFSTKHGVKGAEYENVLVIVDDTLWRNYSFAGVFSGNDSAQRLERSRKLLYVCFSRAISGLAVVCLNQLNAAELAGAKALLDVESAPLFS